MIQLNLTLARSAMGLISVLVQWFPAAIAFADERQTVIATIGQQDVTLADVDLLLGREAPNKALPRATRDLSLAILAKQRRALETMRRMKLAAGPSAIDRWIATQPSAQPGSANSDEWLTTRARRAGVSENTLRESLAFRLSWKAYLDRHLSEDTLKKHYENQTHRFDGSIFSIERISIAVPVGESEARDLASKQLNALREKLGPRDKALTDQVLRKLSASDDSELQVQRETITGTSPVDPEILDAAVKTAPMRWSPPIHSVIGVHLIRVIEIETGNTEFEDAKDEVRAHVLVFLLDYLAEQSEELLPLRLETDKK